MLADRDVGIILPYHLAGACLFEKMTIVTDLLSFMFMPLLIL
jgi:hypothetical protein